MTDGARFARRAALLVTALVLVAWGAIVVEHRLRRGPLRAAWARTIAEMRAAGEPLAASDLRGGSPGPGHELGAWLDGFESRADERWLSRAGESYSPAGASTFTTTKVGGIIVTHASSRPVAAAAAVEVSVWTVLQTVLGEERTWQRVASGEASGLEALRELRAGEHALFLELEGLDAVEGIDAEDWVERVLAFTTSEPPNTNTAFAAAQMLALDALLAGTEEDRARVETALRRMLVLARLSSDAPSLLGHRIGCSVLFVTGIAIEECLGFLSVEFVARELEPALASLDVRSGLVRAMQAETLHVIASPVLRGNLGIPKDVAPEDLALHLGVDELQDLQDELTRRRAVAAALALSHAQGQAALTAACAGGRPSQRVPFSSMYAPGIVSYRGHSVVYDTGIYLEVHEQSIERQLGLAFLRLRLRERVAGADAARELATTLTDPYDGQPLRARVADDGSVLVWSVGPDGVDQTASAPEMGPVGDDVQLELGGD